LLARKALDGKSSMPIIECPVKGVDLKELRRNKRIKINGKKIQLTKMGKIVAAGEISTRFNKIKKEEI
jgi:hypothetical protein